MIKRALLLFIIFCSMSLILSAQTAVVKGILTDEFKTPVPGIKIRLSETNFNTLMNDAPMTDLTNGRTLYNTWSGLNDVVRSRETTLGLAPANYSFGSVGGVYSIDSRASHQRKQLQVSYSLSNRSYDNRLM